MAFKIEWAPLNVPMHRRLEVLSAGVQMFSILFGELITLFIFLLLLFEGNIYIQTLCVIYLVFLYLDRGVGDVGGRGQGSNWLRNWPIWRHFANYFPVDLVKTAELRPDRHYLFALYPHGLLSSAAFANFNTNYSKWKTLFPGIRSKLMTLNFHFHIPLFREIVLGWGMGSVSAHSIINLLTQSTDSADPRNKDGYTSNGVMIVVGGAHEAIYCRPKNYRIVLKKRKGFVKIALITGTPIVPVFSFNEVDLFDQPANPPGSLMRRYQEFVKRTTGMTPVFFIGRGLFQYTYGWIPRRRKLTTVVGAPIEFEKNENPTYDDIDELHQRYCKELNNLFEAHKHNYVEGADDVNLVME